MTQPSHVIAQALQRHGDELYQLALLLTADRRSAAAVMLTTVRSLAAGPAEPLDEQHLVATLLAALPPESPRRLRAPQPEWARDAPDAERAARLAQVARLPPQQRLILALPPLRGWDHEQIAQLLNSDVAHVQEQTRDALLTLAAHIDPALPTALHGDDLPAACQPTRAALALDSAAVRYDPAIRGHLALCAACRTVEQAWHALSATVEDALRSALRGVPLPGTLDEDLHAVLEPRAAPQHVQDQRVWRVLLPVLVLVVIGVLVLPRAPSPIVATSSAPPGPALAAELVQRALDQLYAPPPEAAQHPQDTWHGRWAMQWNFADGTYATLNGDLWIDHSANRHRVQLVHEAGGGPYEFQLADGTRHVAYAASESYGASLYPALYSTSRSRVRLHVPADQQPAMLQARLGAGAWGLARSYLQQAQRADDLQSWGRQQTIDGATLEVLGFRGVSPLGLPPDAPNAPSYPTTMLLTFDITSGTLIEVRELAGPAGSEQVGRVTWRYLGGEWLTAAPDISAAFDLRQAWNGTGTFVNEQALPAHRALPLIPANAVQPSAELVLNPWRWGMVFRQPPPGATAAALLDQLPGSGNWSSGTTIYIGEGRFLALQTRWINGRVRPAEFLGGEGEAVARGERDVRLRAAEARRYQALVMMPGTNPRYGPAQIVQISARGYSRSELLELIDTLGMLDATSYQAQAALFIEPHALPDAARQALLGTLTSTRAAAPDTLRRIAEATYRRHGTRTDQLPDPYHVPLFGGRPEEVRTNRWIRTAPDGSLQAVAIAAYDTRGILLSQSYSDASVNWYFDRPTQTAAVYPVFVASLDSWVRTFGHEIALRMLACGNTQIEHDQAGNRVLVSSEQNWLSQSCLMPGYPQLDSNSEPYILDLNNPSESPLTVSLWLDASGQPARVEVQMGGPTPMLLESWALVGDDLLPVAQAPADLFRTSPPDALISDDSTLLEVVPTSTIHTVTLSDALDLVPTTLWQLPPGTGAELQQVEAGASDNRFRVGFATIFEDALARGLVVRLRYRVSQTAARQLDVYQGPAQKFGDFLRARATWADSRPVQLRVGARDVNGWQVTTRENGTTWTLFELDGTLLALNAALDEQIRPLLEQLAPVQR